MTNLSIIENKISSAKKYLKILEKYQKYSQEEIENDVDRRGAVERYLYLAAQSSIDLADALIAYKNFRKPATLGESFRILEENGVILPELTEKMVKMTGFRNVVAHDYDKINYDIIYDMLQNRLDDIKVFLEVIAGLQ
jgi:uncharacterized protein YutE (UPF0331/DUF86 family)